MMNLWPALIVNGAAVNSSQTGRLLSNATFIVNRDRGAFPFFL